MRPLRPSGHRASRPIGPVCVPTTSTERTTAAHPPVACTGPPRRAPPGPPDVRLAPRERATPAPRVRTLPAWSVPHTRGRKHTQQPQART
eukprot:5175342-Prymnesium_polylepis.1